MYNYYIAGGSVQHNYVYIYVHACRGDYSLTSDIFRSIGLNIRPL